MKSQDGLSGARLYLSDGSIEWVGFVSVSYLKVSEDTKSYFDDNLMMSSTLPDRHVPSIKAFTYPKELDDIIESQSRASLAYLEGDEDTGLIHIWDHALFFVDEKTFVSIGDQTQPELFDFETQVSTTPKPFSLAPTSHIIIDLSLLPSSIRDDIFNVLYVQKRLPDLIELYTIIETPRFKVYDNNDGTWTAVMPELLFMKGEDGYFEITSPTAIMVDDKTYSLSSYSTN